MLVFFGIIVMTTARVWQGGFKSADPLNQDKLN